MKIALDFDKTYDADRIFWNRFIESCWERGNDVRIVTYRNKELDNIDAHVERDIPIHYTNGVAKKFYVEEFLFWTPDIWIDDLPNTILENSKHSNNGEKLAEWRATRKY